MSLMLYDLYPSCALPLIFRKYVVPRMHYFQRTKAMSRQPPPTPAADEASYRAALLTTGAATTPGRLDDAVASLSFAGATSPRRVSRRGPRAADDADECPAKKQDVSATPPRPSSTVRVLDAPPSVVHAPSDQRDVAGISPDTVAVGGVVPQRELATDRRARAACQRTASWAGWTHLVF